jgi:hypothetical protein
MGVAALAQGRKEYAARLAGAVASLREAPLIGTEWWWRRPSERMGEALRAALDEAAFVAAWAEGRAMSLEDAVEFALELDTPP